MTITRTAMTDDDGTGTTGTIFNNAWKTALYDQIDAAIVPVVFPATQVPSADPNTLDDYEEGTWTPTIAGSGGTTGQTYTVRAGTYTKIGRLVVAQFTATLSAKGTITSSVQISGLPFTADSTSNSFSVGSVQWSSLSTSWVSVITVVTPATTTASVRGCTAAAVANSTDLVAADISNTTTLVGTLTYRASA